MIYPVKSGPRNEFAQLTPVRIDRKVERLFRGTGVPPVLEISEQEIF
jgi:hypothetical protein